jgi:putative transposase
MHAKRASIFGVFVHVAPLFEPGNARPGTVKRGGRLPHHPGIVGPVFITFRLADALPFPVRRTVAPQPAAFGDALERARTNERDLDKGWGCCVLRVPEAADVVAASLRHFDADRYDLLTWVVMPNHVHVAVRTNGSTTIDRIVHSWKWYSASQINRHLGRSGPLWQREYFDRRIRDEHQLERVVTYIEANPVHAGLCRSMFDWKWSGIHRRLGRPRSENEGWSEDPTVTR